MEQPPNGLAVRKNAPGAAENASDAAPCLGGSQLDTAVPSA